MCLILLGYKMSEKYPLVIAANRDEFYARPTAPMHWWDKPRNLLAGKDLEGGGTWFGVRKDGFFAGLTNYRDPSRLQNNAPSRGNIILECLNSKKHPISRFEKDDRYMGRYNGFNLLLGNVENVNSYSNLRNKLERVGPGVHGLSNKFLNTSWPKVEVGKKAVRDILQTEVSVEALFDVLATCEVYPDELLPQTGVGLPLERMLSSLFIKSESYGTRTSVVLIQDRMGKIEVVERTYDYGKKVCGFKDNNFIFAAPRCHCD